MADPPGPTNPGSPTVDSDNMGTSTVKSGRKTVSDKGILTTWTSLIEVEVPDRTAVSFFVWDGGGSNDGDLRLEFSEDNSRWFYNVNGVTTSIAYTAGTSVMMTNMEFTNDTPVYSPFMRVSAKKDTSRESMNATARWPDFH